MLFRDFLKENKIEIEDRLSPEFLKDDMPIFVLLSNELSEAFDEEKNDETNEKYKIIGRKIYQEFIMKKCKNER